MPRKWLVMVYLGANKDLSVDFLWDLKEMQEANVGPGGLVTVVAQYDPGQGIPTQRYVINRRSAQFGVTRAADGWLVLDRVGIDPGPVDPLIPQLKRTLENLANALPYRKKQAVLNPLNRVKLDPQDQDSSNPLTLLRFILWGINKYRADHYVVVLSGHGSGADGDFLPDPTFRDSLTLPSLREVFKSVQTKLGRKLDILGLDSCLMSMVEVYYEVAGSVSYLVGAEGFEPASGWPYQRILKSLANRSGMGPGQFARQIVDDYVLYYFDYALAGLSVDLSACEVKDGAAANSLPNKIGALAKKLNEKLKDRAALSSIISARRKAQSYKFDQYVDLWHFCHLLPKEEQCEDLLWPCKIVQDEIDKIVLNTSYVGPESQDSHGLSVYFPWYEVSKQYKDLEFTQRARYTRVTAWYDFLKEFTKAFRALELVESDGMTVEGSNIRYPGKTLYSGRTLHSGQTSLHSGQTSLHSGQTSAGPESSLSVGYGKPPSLVWKPPKGAIEDHVLELHLSLAPHYQGLTPQEAVQELNRRMKALTKFLGIKP